MLSEGSSEGWKWGFGLVAAGGCERWTPGGDGGSRAGLHIPLGPPRWGHCGERRCPNVPCPPGRPARGGSAGPLAGLSPNPHFQGTAGVLSPGLWLRAVQGQPAAPSGAPAPFWGLRALRNSHFRCCRSANTCNGTVPGGTARLCQRWVSVQRGHIWLTAGSRTLWRVRKSIRDGVSLDFSSSHAHPHR